VAVNDTGLRALLVIVLVMWVRFFIWIVRSTEDWHRREKPPRHPHHHHHTTHHEQDPGTHKK
jgi:hypothetical protein